MTAVLTITSQVRSNRVLRAVLTFAVSYVAFVGAVFYSMGAQAATSESLFVPAKCGDVVRAEQADIALAQICFGDLKGLPTAHQMSAVQFVTEDGSTAIFQVKEIANLYVKLMNGAVRSNVILVGPRGEEASMKIVRQKDGSIQMANGLLSRTSYQVPSFL
mgnify:CR=1 FL=1